MFRKFFHLLILVFTLTTTTLLYAQVVINELMIEPNNPDFGEIFSEYIELANYGEEAVDLEAWSVQTNAGSEAIGSNLVIEPGGFILLGISDNTTLTLGVEMDYAWGIGSDIDLNNTSDDIRLIDSGGNIADEVSYDSGWTLTSGASLEKLNPALSLIAFSASTSGTCFTAMVILRFRGLSCANTAALRPVSNATSTITRNNCKILLTAFSLYFVSIFILSHLYVKGLTNQF